MTTVALRKRLNPTKDGLAPDQQVPATAGQQTPTTSPVILSANPLVPDPPGPNPPFLPPLYRPDRTRQAAHTTTYSKEAATVAKIYTDSQKYDRVSDSFDFKLTIFYDVCQRSGLPPDGYIVAFPTMLKGLAQDHYYHSKLSTRPFPEVCDHIRQFFEGPEYYRKSLSE